MRTRNLLLVIIFCICFLSINNGFSWTPPDHIVDTDVLNVYEYGTFLMRHGLKATLSFKTV